MRTRLDQPTQQAGESMQPYHNFFRIDLGRFDRVLHRLATATQSVVLIVSVLLGFWFIPPTAPAYAQVLNPRQVVAYALTLEKLEDDLYERAVTATQPGGSLASLPSAAKAAIRSYGEDENQHVIDLSAVLRQLGGNPNAVTIPDNPNYNAILGRNPFANPKDFLLALQRVEDLGVAAYKGQVTNLQAAGQAADTVLAGALEIHTVEARHAAGIRYLRQTFYDVDVRPWIRSSSEVVYRESRRSPIPFSNVAFDGFATRDEVLELVGPILRQ